MPTLLLITGLLPVPVDSHWLELYFWGTMLTLTAPLQLDPEAVPGSFEELLCVQCLGREQSNPAVKLFPVRVR